MKEPEYEWNFEQAIATAEENGLEVIHGSEVRLLIDLDSEDTKTFDLKLSWLRKGFDLKELDRWRSKSGKHWHILLSCKPCSFAQRIALQFALGSDPKRETLALMMQADGQEVSFLFRPRKSVLNEIETRMLA